MLDLETDKVVLEVPAPADGILQEVMFQTGDTVLSGQLLAKIMSGAAAEKQDATAPETKVVDSDDKSASPAVRRLLAENDLQPG